MALYQPMERPSGLAVRARSALWSWPRTVSISSGVSSRLGRMAARQMSPPENRWLMGSQAGGAGGFCPALRVGPGNLLVAVLPARGVKVERDLGEPDVPRREPEPVQPACGGMDPAPEFLEVEGGQLKGAQA